MKRRAASYAAIDSGVASLCASGHRQRRYAVGLLAGDAQPLAAGREDGEACASSQQRLRQLRAWLDEVFGIVEDEQERARREVLHDRIDQSRTRLFLDAEDAGDGLRQQRRVAQGGKLDEPRAVGVGVGPLPGELDRQAGLAASARARQGEEPRTTQQLRELGDLILAADEAREVVRQVVLRRCRGSGRRRTKLGHFQHEPVAAPGNRRDRVRAEHLAKGGNVDLQGVLRHDHLAPHAL